MSVAETVKMERSQTCARPQSTSLLVASQLACSGMILGLLGLLFAHEPTVLAKQPFLRPGSSGAQASQLSSHFRATCLLEVIVRMCYRYISASCLFVTHQRSETRTLLVSHIFLPSSQPHGLDFDIAITSQTFKPKAKPQSLKYTNLDLAPNLLSSLLTARSQNKSPPRGVSLALYSQTIGAGKQAKATLRDPARHTSQS